jgi:hypothetical protein
MTKAKQQSVSATAEDWEDFKALADELGLNPSALISALAQRRFKLVPAMDNSVLLLSRRVESVENELVALRRQVAGVPPLGAVDLP